MDEKAVLKRYALSSRENRYALINLDMASYVIELYEQPDEAAMLAAVQKAVELHPVFHTRVIFDEGLFCFEDNPEPPVVFRTDNAPRRFGDQSTNRYPWILVIGEKRLIFHACHAITDGTGVFSFLKTLLHLYFERTGVVFSAGDSDFPRGLPEERIENPVTRFADPDCHPLGVPKFAGPARVDPTFLDFGNRRIWELVLSEQELRRLSRGSETTVFSVLSCIFARAMERAYHISSGNIDIRIPVNFRRFFPTYTERFFSYGFSVCYLTDRMKHLPDETVETALRSQLDLWLDIDDLTETLNSDLEQLRRMKEDPTAMDRILHFQLPTEPRANIIYSQLPAPDWSEELLARISNIRFDFPNYPKLTVYAMGVFFRSELHVSLHQCSRNDCLISALEEVLRARGLGYSLYPHEPEAELLCVDYEKLRPRR